MKESNTISSLRRSVGVYHAIGVAAILALVPSLSLAQFEGVVTSKNLTLDESGARIEYVMTMWVKKDMVRIEIPAFGGNPAFVAIYRGDLGVSWMLDESSKTYIEMRKGDSKEPHGTQSVLRFTKKKKNILGYPCEQVFAKDGEAETELWVTSSLKGLAQELFETLGGATAESGGGWNDEIAKRGLFPLNTSTRFEGKVIEESEIVAVKKESVDVTRFHTPGEYSRQRVEQPNKE
jgi:hypothetical protein